MLAAPFTVVAVLGVIRFAGSVVQLWLNRRLGRVQAIEGSDRLDWGLFLLTYLGSISAAATIESFSAMTQLIALFPVLIPVTALQMRMRGRSLRAYRAATAMP